MKVEFTPIPGVDYMHDYVALFKDIANKTIKNPNHVYRELCKIDSFFLLYFVLHYSTANHPFVVQACREVDKGPDDYTLDLWARGHFKSSILTTVGVLKIILNNPEARVCIMSHTRPAAKGFLRDIKIILETNEFLKQCFPDVLYDKPTTQAPKWSEDDGLFVKRRGYYREASIEAWGLVEGMPTGKHFSHRIYDDIETKDTVGSGDMILKLQDAFALSQNLKDLGGKHRVIGTPYSHLGLLQVLRDRKNPDGSSIYHIRVKPATDDGTPNGNPVLITQKELDNLKCDEYAFNSQQLLNPTPVGSIRLESRFMKEVSPTEVPPDVLVFMTIDQAGDLSSAKNGIAGDDWAIQVFGVMPKTDNLGLSDVFVLDAFYSPLDEGEAIDQAVKMYLRAGVVQVLGVEKVGISTTHLHIQNALSKQRRHVSEDSGNFALLRPAGRTKQKFIESSLAWPLHNGKIHIVSTIPTAFKDRLRNEFDMFPFWRDDALNGFAYLYDILKDDRFRFRFGIGMKYESYEIPELGVV